MRFQIEQYQIKIFDPLLIRSLNAYRNTGSKFGVIPKTLGAMRELYAVTKDQEVKKLALDMKHTYDDILAAKDDDNQAPLMYKPKKVTPDMNDYEDWLGRTDGYLRLTDMQNTDVYFGSKVLKEHGYLFYFDEPRTGKTMKSIALMDSMKCDKVIIAQLGGVLEQFKANVEDWQQRDRKVITLSGAISKAKRIKIWDEFRDSEEAMVIVVSYDTIKNDLDHLEGTDYDILICDEPHKKIKNPVKSRFKAIKKISKDAKYILMLTGTPLDNLLSETYIYLNIALPYTFKNKELFIHRYFETKKNVYADNAPDIVTDWNYRKFEIIELFNYVSTNRKNLQKRPEIEYVDIPMTKLQRRMIEDLTESGEMKLDEEIDYKVWDPELEQEIMVRSDYLSVEAGVTVKGYIRQILTGPSAIKGISNKKASNKLKYILKFIKANPQARTMIFTDHKTFIKKTEWVFKKLGIKYAVIHGEVNLKKRDAIRKQLNKGEIQVVIGQILTMSTGGTFNYATHVFFLNLPYVPSELRQASDRLLDFSDEKNEGKKVFVLQHPGTADMEQRLILDDKREKQSVVNSYDSKIQKLKGGN